MKKRVKAFAAATMIAISMFSFSAEAMAAAPTWDGGTTISQSKSYNAKKDMAVSEDITIPKGATVTILKNKYAYIENGARLIIDGTLTVKGTLDISLFSEVLVNGKLTVGSSGKVVGSGIISCGKAGKISGSSRIECGIADSSGKSFLRVSGRKIVDGSGKEVQLRGTGFTSGEWVYDDMTYKLDNQKSMYEELSEMGFNSVRLCFSHILFEDDSKPYQYKQGGWDFLDESIAFAKRNGIYLILNMQHPQGGYQSEGEGAALWTKKENQDRYVALMTEIARRYKDEPTIAGFGLINEPVVPLKATYEATAKQWPEFAQRIVDSIRTVDKNHIIFVEGNTAVINTADGSLNWEYFGDEYSFLLDDDNTAYEFHFYEPFNFTHQGTEWTGLGDTVTFYPSVQETKKYIGYVTETNAANRIDHNSSGWQYSESTLFTAENTDANFCGLNLKAHRIGAGGTVYYDDIKVEEYDRLGRLVRTVYSDDYSFEPEALSYWSADGTGKAVYDGTEGHNGNGCIKIYGACDILNANTIIDFEMKQGYSYKVSGYLKCSGISSSANIGAGLAFSKYDVSKVGYDKEYIEKRLSRFIDFSEKNNVPIYLGEFGVMNVACAENRGGEQWIEDVLSVCDKHDIGFVYWAFKGGFGFYNNEADEFNKALSPELYNAWRSFNGKSVLSKQGRSRFEAAATGAWDDPIVWDGKEEFQQGLTYTINGNISASEVYIPAWTTLYIPEEQALNADKIIIDGTLNNDGQVTSKNALVLNGCLSNQGRISPAYKKTSDDVKFGKLIYNKGYLAQQTWLYLGWNDLTSVSGIANATAAQNVDISYNYIRSITPMKSMKWLKELNTERNNITSLSTLSGLKKLSVLKLGKNDISSLKPLSSLTMLRYLDASFNPVTTLPSFSKMKLLTHLDLTGCNISGALPKLNGAKNIQQLYMGANRITRIGNISSLTKLRTLDLSCNEIADISAVSKLTSLNTLKLTGNEIRDISALKKLTSLTELRLDCNHISDISALKGLKKLTVLSLNYNEISDVSALSSLNSLKTLYLYGNKLTEKQVEELQKAVPQCAIYC